MMIRRTIADRLVCKDPGRLTPYGLYKLIMDAVEPELPYLAHGGEQPHEILPMLDYGQPSAWSSWETLGDIEDFESGEIRPLVYPGGSEGVYLNVTLSVPQYGRSAEEYPLFIFKTLGEGPDAYAAMGALGGVISYALELFQMLIWED